ncbi:hypothetical protein [Trinickia symbiotica]|uniref:Uncharacterized protein n=1 Tax=Trinickia symbiotica TaxID=863227 RepID=A0A2N7XAS4_9BURK|nr:hypothetical protein [Trinickia symbiotica]PMS38734.1 hypothetical protein C0Z20_02480 [Trinickia symbiotica]
MNRKAGKFTIDASVDMPARGGKRPPPYRPRQPHFPRAAAETHTKSKRRDAGLALMPHLSRAKIEKSASSNYQ